MQLRRPLLVGALVVLAAILWWLALDRREAPEELRPAASREPVATPQPVAAPLARAPEPVAEAPTPEPSEPVAAPAAPAVEPPQPSAADPIPPDTRGFVAALQQVYESSPRASNAGQSEAELERAFRGEGSATGLLRSVLCREHVCRLELHWTPAHAAVYQRAMEELTAGNAKNLATRAEEPDESGAVRVEIFWRRESAR